MTVICLTLPWWGVNQPLLMFEINTCYKVNPFFIMTGQKAKLNDWKERYLRNKEYPLHFPLSYYGGERWIRIAGSATYLVQCQLELCRLLRSRQNQVSAGVVHTEIVNVKSGFKHCVWTFQAREKENHGPVKITETCLWSINLTCQCIPHPFRKSFIS